MCTLFLCRQPTWSQFLFQHQFIAILLFPNTYSLLLMGNWSLNVISFYNWASVCLLPSVHIVPYIFILIGTIETILYNHNYKDIIFFIFQTLHTVIEYTYMFHHNDFQYIFVNCENCYHDHNVSCWLTF